MSRILIVVSLCIFLANCNDGVGAGQEQEMKDSLLTQELVITDTATINIRDTKAKLPDNKDLGSKIAGFWAKEGSENANFVIEKKKIYYPAHDKSYSYTLIRDSIRIKYDDFTDSYLIKMKGPDTLLLVNDEEHIFYRFKN